MKMLKFNLLLLSGILFVLNVAVAASLPKHYPENFTYTGMVDDIHLNDQLIIVGDKGFRVSNSLVINRLDSNKAGSLSSLRRGMNIGIVRSKNESLFEIWELPNNYDHNPVDQ